MRRILITFYSHKGGVGRTQALAHVAVGLANRGQDVVILDMDLESPGVHAFFSPANQVGKRFSTSELGQQPGLLDFLEQCDAMPEEEPDIVSMLLPCAHETLRRGRIRLITPGRLDASYSDRLARFSWPRFYEERGGYAYMELLREQLFSKARADVVLVDSRTGFTDPGLICTFQLPEVVVALFAMHAQGIEGARRIASGLVQADEVTGSRVEHVLLVPSRVDEYGVPDEARKWADEADRVLRGLPKTELLRDFNQRIPYYPKVAYGEQILDLDSEPNPLTTAYAHLLGRLTALQEDTEGTAPTESLRQVTEPQWPLIRATSERIAQDARSLFEEASSLDLSHIDIAEAPRRAHTIAFLGESLCARLDELDSRIVRFEQIVGIQTSSRRLPPTAKRTGEWRAIAERLAGDLDATRGRVFEAVRRQLVEAALRDEELVSSVWLDAERLLTTGSAAAIREGLREIRERVGHRTLKSLLRRRALRREDLEFRIADAGARRQWLDERIQEEIERAADDPRAAQALWNLLALRVTELGEQESHGSVWNAYDILCLLFPTESTSASESSAPSVELFEQVGRPLWLASWSRVFHAQPSDIDVEPPSGNEASAQLRFLAQANPAVILPVVDRIQRGLEAWCDLPFEDRAPAMRALCRARRTDPCLREALRVTLRAKSRGAETLAAAWLLDAERYDTEELLSLEEVLALLLQKGRIAEAFYLLSAAAQSDAAVLKCHRLDSVYTAYLARDLGRLHPSSPALALWRDVEMRGRISATRSGKALLSAIAAGLCRAPEEVVWAAQAEPKLARIVLDVLGEMPHSAIAPLSERDLGQIRATLTALAHTRELHIYPTWVPSAHYERKLKEWIDAAREAILTTPKRPGAARPYPSNVKTWIAATYRTLHDDNARVSMPDPDAERRIHELFKKADESLDALWTLCPEDGLTTLEDMLERARQHEKALNNLRSWLSAQEAGIDAHAGRAVAALTEVLP